jgi:hypothetical protein
VQFVYKLFCVPFAAKKKYTRDHALIFIEIVDEELVAQRLSFMCLPRISAVALGAPKRTTCNSKSQAYLIRNFLQEYLRWKTVEWFGHFNCQHNMWVLFVSLCPYIVFLWFLKLDPDQFLRCLLLIILLQI